MSTFWGTKVMGAGSVLLHLTGHQGGGAPGPARRGSGLSGAKRWLIGLVSLAVLAALADVSRPARAQTGLQAPDTSAGAPVDVEAQLGFSNTFRLGRWTPLVVTVSNRGNDLSGFLEVQVTGGNEFQGNLYNTFHRRPLELPRDARKRLRFTVFLDSFARPLTMRVVSGERELAHQSIDLRQTFTNNRLILALSRDADLDYLNDGGGDGLRVLYPHPELLPDHWQGYDGVEAIVIHGVSLERLSTRQYEAIKKWMARGGIAAVSGGPDHALLRTARLAELLPGTPAGTVRLENASALNEALLASLSAPPLDAPEPFTLDRFTNPRGRVLYRVESTPLVVREPRGRGAVLY
ncbi:MAG: hypothetical protein ACR2RL_14125, partial [Gammaproteobacteria bacterium]